MNPDDETPEPTPITGDDLDRWTAGLDEASRPVAAVAGGVDLAELGRWNATSESVANGLDPFALPPDQTAFRAWDLRPHQLAAPASGLLAAVGPWLTRPFDAEIPYRRQPPPLRLAVTGNVIPGDVVPRLLACPGVGSAVIPAQRPPGALRRREWSWPLRIGVLDDDLVAAFEALRGDEGVPAQLVDVSDVRVDPGGVDLLVVREPPERAAALVVERRQLANAVVCVGEPGGTWPVVDAHLALIRAATAAVATIITPPDDAGGIVRHVLRTLRMLSHAHPIDVALTAGFERRLLIAGELDALADTTLPSLIQRRARQLRLDFEVLATAEPPEPEPVGAEPPPEPEPGDGAVGVGGDRGLPEAPPLPPAPPLPAPAARSPSLTRAEPSLSMLEELHRGAFGHESAEASAAPELGDEVDAAIDEAAVPRLLQVYVRPPTPAQPAPGQPPPPDVPAPGVVDDNVVRAGANAVDVFIGPLERGALRGPEAPNRLLGFTDPTINRVRLTVVLVPLIPRGEPVRTELDVPRTGRSANARLIWQVPEGSERAQARIMVLHRNRVIQTALLTGRVGAKALLTERLVLWDALNHLDDRQPFDRAFVLNHDDDGGESIVSHADGVTTVEAMAEVDAVTERIRKYLLKATLQRSTTGPAAAATARKILIDVAVEGNDLFGTLESHLGRLGGAKRIQIVTARSGRFLPLEMVYDRPAPDENAQMCANWLAGEKCGPHCFADADDTTIVCPSVFWGMSRVIERHHTSLTDPNGTAFLLTATPTRGQRTLKVTRALVAASDKVKDPDLKPAVDALRVGATRVKSWDDWTAALQALPPTDLLVLMPHTDPALKTLEISTKTLRNGRIEKRHVTGGHAVSPVVVLFGCDTAGSDEDPAGYATRFMAKGAAVVFSTLTMLLAGHAAEMSAQLAALLLDAGRAEQPLGELVSRFRRDAVRGGLISALSVTAYGDADWKV